MQVSELDDKIIPKIERGKIYSNVYGRRIDDRPVTRTAQLCTAMIKNDTLQFSSGYFEQAISDGMFQLAIPCELSAVISQADRFSIEFFRGSGFGLYGAYSERTSDEFNDPLLGFHKRSNQIEQFLLERRFWLAHYPYGIQILGEALTEISRIILRSVFTFVGLPVSLWAKASGGCIEKAGSYHLTFNHYRPAIGGIGLASHKDDGFLTILRTASCGLEMNRTGEWERVVPDSGLFVVNFGLTMELLTRHCLHPVTAILHRVTHQNNDRSSFGHFTSSACEPNRTVNLYSFDKGALHTVCSARELIDINDHEIYEGSVP